MKNGFTLFEVLVYMAVLSLMLDGLFTSVIYLHDAVEKSEQKASELLHSLNARDAADQGTHEL